MDKKYFTRPLWFWNAKPTKNGITEIMENCLEKDKYVGFGILPFNACDLKYMGEEYLDLYGHVLKEAKRLGMKICLYDEWWFPSGYAGGILKEKYPEALAKRLDVQEYNSCGREFSINLPTDGKIMAVVGMKNSQRVNLAEYVDGNVLNWTAPEDDYLVLCFILRSADWDHVDFLSSDAVKKFIECTHQVYYERFSEYFGDVIDSSFYDEPQFYGAKGRMWTEAFNQKFIDKYGLDPAIYYPALFYDIGEETCFARNALLSLRADMYSEAFPKTIQNWCTEHKITLTGHVDQEEMENPCGITGDLMKSFKYQDMPGIDEIIVKDRATCAYKIISSSAVNWNKNLVMCECFGAFNDLTEEIIYHESYDMFTKGVNYFVPHAVWYETSEDKIVFKPELSYRNDYYGKIIPQYSKYYNNVAKYLQNGVQVNDVAILYPIESLQYQYTLNWGGDPYLGGPTCETNDYMKLGQYLSREANCDFTFLHPEILETAVNVKDGILTLNKTNHVQNFKVIIMPGMKAVSYKTMQVLKEFVLSGGTLIATTELPVKSSEMGKDKQVVDIVKELFSTDDISNVKGEINHKNGGKCYAFSFSERDKLLNVLINSDLDTKVLNVAYGLQYIRKRYDEGYDVWYFVNLGEDIDTSVQINGEYILQATDPKTGEEINLNYSYKKEKTLLNLKLNKGQSVIIKGEKKSAKI